jgi:ribosomal-protein-alanine N-acetyltransferase
MTTEMAIEVRAAVEADVAALLTLQQAAPEAAQWSAGALLDALAGCLVAVDGDSVVGFLLCRALPDAESEILNLAVDPQRRRQGIAGRLLGEWLSQAAGAVFLEVRESNAAARALYAEWGFVEQGLRPAYYHRPVEAAVVMTRLPGPLPKKSGG